MPSDANAAPMRGMAADTGLVMDAQADALIVYRRSRWTPRRRLPPESAGRDRRDFAKPREELGTVRKRRRQKTVTKKAYNPKTQQTEKAIETPRAEPVGLPPKKSDTLQPAASGQQNAGAGAAVNGPVSAIWTSRESPCP
ncbi:MAG: hypothetical protein HC850_02535 [Rhodomicrobium sp.]|nr:hypothetical protein [Rhodomicrobium sp.]